MAIFQDAAPNVAGTIITLWVLAYITLGLRIYTRITRSSWGIEDTVMVVAVLPFTVLAIACLASSFNGVGIHITTLEKPENVIYQTNGLFWFFLFECFYCITIIPIKLSISLMLVRIAQNRKMYIYSQYIAMGLFTTMNAIAAFYIIFECSPVAAAWDTSLLAEGGTCNPSYILQDIYFATTAVNIATDWFTAFLPIPLLWNVKLNFNAKVSVATILGLGVFASLSACIRLKYTVLLTNTDDYLYGLANIVIWGYAENGIGMIVGCVSTLRPLFRRMLRLGGTSSGGNTGPTQQHLTGPGAAGGGGGGFPSQSRRHYLKSNDTTFELGEMSAGERAAALRSVDREKSASAQGVMEATITAGGGGGDGSSISSADGDSQKQILQQDAAVLQHAAGGSPPGAGGLDDGLFSPRGITVNRQVTVTHQ